MIVDISNRCSGVLRWFAGRMRVKPCNPVDALRKYGFFTRDSLNMIFIRIEADWKGSILPFLSTKFWKSRTYFGVDFVFKPKNSHQVEIN